MIRAKKTLTVAISLLLFVLTLSVGGTAYALTTGGVTIIAIDGDNDANVTVDISNLVLYSPYTYGYFLNGDTTTFHALSYDVYNPLGAGGSLNLQGGDIIDFALYDSSRYYTLSGDTADNSYGVTMTFTNQVTTGSPQQPAGWSSPYYYDARIVWRFTPVNTTNELELSMNFSRNGGNDGIAPTAVVPVPEPSTLLLLGGGFIGFGLIRRRLRR